MQNNQLEIWGMKKSSYPVIDSCNMKRPGLLLLLRDWMLIHQSSSTVTISSGFLGGSHFYLVWRVSGSLVCGQEHNTMNQTWCRARIIWSGSSLWKVNTEPLCLGIIKEGTATFVDHGDKSSIKAKNVHLKQNNANFVREVFRLCMIVDIFFSQPNQTLFGLIIFSCSGSLLLLSARVTPWPGTSRWTGAY